MASTSQARTMNVESHQLTPVGYRSKDPAFSKDSVIIKKKDFGRVGGKTVNYNAHKKKHKGSKRNPLQNRRKSYRRNSSSARQSSPCVEVKDLAKNASKNRCGALVVSFPCFPSTCPKSFPVVPVLIERSNHKTKHRRSMLLQRNKQQCIKLATINSFRQRFHLLA